MFRLTKPTKNEHVHLGVGITIGFYLTIFIWDIWIIKIYVLYNILNYTLLVLDDVF